MAKFMLLLGGADLDKRANNAELGPVMLERYVAWLRSIDARGQFVGSHRLNDQVGARLGLRGGKVVDGPFVETKEAVGGLFIVDVASLEEATALARECPVLDMQNGYVEVRLVEDSRTCTP